MLIGYDNGMGNNKIFYKIGKKEFTIDFPSRVKKINEENPDALYNIDELKKIAQYVEVDEIHIFNKQGVIISGTHPEYYGYS